MPAVMGMPGAIPRENGWGLILVGRRGDAVPRLAIPGAPGAGALTGMSRSLLAVVAMGSKQTQPLIPGRLQRLRSPVLQVEHLDCGECSAKSKSRRARRFRRVLYLSLLHGHEKPMMPRDA